MIVLIHGDMYLFVVGGWGVGGGWGCLDGMRVCLVRAMMRPSLRITGLGKGSLALWMCWLRMLIDAGEWRQFDGDMETCLEHYGRSSSGWLAGIPVAPH